MSGLSLCKMSNICPIVTKNWMCLTDFSKIFHHKISRKCFNWGLSFLGAFARLRKVTICSVVSVLLSVSLSVCPHGPNRLPPDGFSINLIFHNFRKFVEKCKFHLTLIRIMSTLLEDLCTFIIICRWSLLRIRNVADNLAEEIETHFVCSKSFF
jgi:hypothetical protein